MSVELNNATALREVPQTEQTEQVEAKNISYKANPNNSLERTPDCDYYEKKNTKKTIGIIAGLVLTAAAVLGVICWHKGKPADGKSKEFFERLKDGWKELVGKGEKAAEDGAGKAGEAASGAKTEAESAAEKAGEAKAEAEKTSEKTVEKVENEPDFYKEYEESLENKKQEIAEINERNEKYLQEQHSKLEKEYSEFWEKGLSEREKTFYETTNKEACAIVNDFNQQYSEKINQYLQIVRKSKTASVKNMGKSELIEEFSPAYSYGQITMKNVMKTTKKHPNGSQIEYYSDKEGKNIFEIRILKDNQLDCVISPRKFSNTSDGIDGAYTYKTTNINNQPREYQYWVILDNNRAKLIEAIDRTTAIPERGFIKSINISNKGDKTFISWNKMDDAGELLCSKRDPDCKLNIGESWFELTP